MANEIQAPDGKSDEQRGKGKRTRAVKTITVKIIKREGASALVQWVDKEELRRAHVPAKELRGNDVGSDILAQGIPYGEDWKRHFESFPNAHDIANDLHRRGIWTAHDFRRRPNEVRAAIWQASINPAIAELNRTMEV